jgi:hypothetical protein
MDPLQSKKPSGGAPPLLDFQEHLTNLAKVSDPRMRIAFLVVMLLFVGGAIVWLQGFRKSLREPARKFTPTHALPASPEEEIGLPPLDLGHAAKIDDSTPEARHRWEGEALSYLLLEARTTNDVQNYRRGLFPLDAGNAPQIAADPAPSRFKFFRFRGRIEYLREENYEDAYGIVEGYETGRVRRGRILLEGDPPARVTFLTTLPLVWQDSNSPETHPPVQPLLDGFVRARGIFVKSFVEEDPGGKQVPTLLFVATRIDRDYEPVPVERLEEIPFHVIRDGPELAIDPETKPLLFRLYPIPLFRLLKFADARAGEKGAALRAKEAEGKPPPRNLRAPEAYEELIHNPGKHRGERYVGLGALPQDPVLFGEEEWQPSLANDSGLDDYMMGWIYTDSLQIVRFAAPVSAWKGLRAGARIRYEGYFFKNQAHYSAKRTEELVPLFVLTDLSLIPVAARDVKWDMILGGSIFAVFLVIVVLVIRNDRIRKGFEAERRRKRQAKSPAS